MSIDQVTFSEALRLMSLPRVVGVDAEGHQITAQNGRVTVHTCGRALDSRSLASEEQIFSITLDEANAIYAQPKQRGAAAKPPLKELGPGPDLRPAHDHQGRPVRRVRHRR